MANLKWFRLYSEAANDVKLNYLSDEQFRVWFKLLCLAAEQEERGIIKEDSFLLSLKVSNGNEELLNSTIQLLTKLKIIEVIENKINFINFKKRQYEYPSEEPEEVNKRVKKHREGKKEEKSNSLCNENETTVKRECNDSETGETSTDNRQQITDSDSIIIDVINTRTREEEISEEEKEKSAVEEIANYLFTVTGRSASPTDYISITEIVNSPEAPSDLSCRLNLIKSTMAALARQKKNKDPANGKINSFSYFVKAILAEYQKLKAKHNISRVKTKQQERIEDDNGVPEGFKELIKLDESDYAMLKEHYREQEARAKEKV